jgi:hypothetical protein
MKCNRCGKDNPADIHTCSLPEALALAEYLDDKPDSDGHCRQAAAELRRLHAEKEALREALTEERRVRLLGQEPDVHWESMRDIRRACYAATDAALTGGKT